VNKFLNIKNNLMGTFLPLPFRQYQKYLSGDINEYYEIVIGSPQYMAMLKDVYVNV